jgi:hypothetical protein
MDRASIFDPGRVRRYDWTGLRHMSALPAHQWHAHEILFGFLAANAGLMPI